MPLQMQMHPLQWPVYILSHNLHFKGVQTSYEDISQKIIEDVVIAHSQQLTIHPL